MINLIKADLYKEINKKSLIYITAFLLLFIIIYLLTITNELSGTLNKEYTKYLTEEEYKLINEHGNYETYKKDYYKYKERMNSEIEINALIKYNKTMETTSYYGVIYFIIGLIMIFITFNNLNYDFISGTLKYIFMSNKSKIKILLSKIISLIIITISMLLITLIISLTITSIINNENILFMSKIIYLNNKFINLPLIYYELIKCFIYLMPIIFLIILTLFICILVKGNNYGLISVILIYLFGTTLTSKLINNGINIVEYTPLPYLDFTYFSDISYILNNIIYNINITINKGIIVFIIYSFILLCTSIKLLKRDI